LAIWSIDDSTLNSRSKQDLSLTDDSNDDEEDDSRYDKVHNKRQRIDSTGKFKDTSSQYKFKKPTKTIKCDKGKRVRAIAYNQRKGEIAAIAMNATFHLFNSRRFEQVKTLDTYSFAHFFSFLLFGWKKIFQQLELKFVLACLFIR
jgi:hypothetical protein